MMGLRRGRWLWGAVVCLLGRLVVCHKEGLGYGDFKLLAAAGGGVAGKRCQ